MQVKKTWVRQSKGPVIPGAARPRRREKRVAAEFLARLCAVGFTIKQAGGLTRAAVR